MDVVCHLHSVFCDARRCNANFVSAFLTYFKFGECEQEKHLRDKFRMQHGAGVVATSDHATGDRATCSRSDVAGKQADSVLSSAATERISSEEIRSLERSPQRGVSVVRGRREGSDSTVEKTTSPSRMNVAAENNQRSTEVRSGSPEKTVHSQTTVCSPGLVVTNDDSSVISRDGQSEHACLPRSGARKASGHVSDNASRHSAVKDHRSQRSTSAGHRGGYVSDTSFSANTNNAANESVRSTAVEGV